MALFRICDHFKNNPKRIDKLIAIKGLPKEWLFRETEEGLELKKPWEIDIDKNIPHEIREFCEPMYVIQRFQALNKDSKQIIEKRQALGFRLDYNSEPGRQLWDDIERYIEETMPRNERIPVPVLCSRDERSAFETFTPRRNGRGSLELVPGPIPLVDLTKYIEVKMEEVQKPSEAILTQRDEVEPSGTDQFQCDDCDFKHRSKQGVRMHRTKKHPKKVKVEA